MSDHNITEWKLQINWKVTEKRDITRRDLSKVDEESFMSDLKNNLDVNSKKTLQQNYNNYSDAIKKTIEKHALLKTKCARAQLISQCVDAGQLNIPPQQ